MTLNDAVSKHATMRAALAELNDALRNHERACEERFGYHAWLDALDAAPVDYEQGKIVVRPGTSVGFVAKYLQAKANAEGRRFEALFNGRPLVAEPGREPVWGSEEKP